MQNLKYMDILNFLMKKTPLKTQNHWNNTDLNIFYIFLLPTETCIAGRYSVKITKKIMNTDEEILWEMGIM